MNGFFKQLNPKSAVVLILTIAMLTMTLLAGVGLFFIDIPAENKEMINLFMGGIISWTGAIVSKFFGQSNEPKTQDEVNSEPTEQFCNHCKECLNE